MVGKQKLKRPPSGCNELRRVRIYFHPFIDRVYARRNKISCSLYLYDTHPAGSDFVDLLQETQRRNLDSGQPGRFKDSRTGRSGYVESINFKINIFHILHPPLLFVNSTETAFFHTCSTLDTFILVDDVRLFDRSADRIIRACSCT